MELTTSIGRRVNHRDGAASVVRDVGKFAVRSDRNAAWETPTAMGDATTALVAMLITETVLLTEFAT